MAISTPAIDSIARAEVIPEQALRYADYYMQWVEDIDPLLAFEDVEIHRHHRALALGHIAYMKANQKTFLSNPTIGEK